MFTEEPCAGLILKLDNNISNVDHSDTRKRHSHRNEIFLFSMCYILKFQHIFTELSEVLIKMNYKLKIGRNFSIILGSVFVDM